MSSIFNKLKARFSGKKDKKTNQVKAQDTNPAEGEVHILPVPGVRIYPYIYNNTKN
jgi:hypothetical protein